MSAWKDISTAPREPRTGVRGPNIIGMDATGILGRTSWVHEHQKGGNCWLLYTGEGLIEWSPTLWIDDPTTTSFLIAAMFKVGGRYEDE